MPFLTASVIGAGVSAGGSILSGIMGNSASKKAADAQVQAAQIASNTEQNMFNQTQQELAPYTGAGTNALSALQKVLGIGPGGGGATNPMLQMLGIGPNGQPTGAGINPASFEGSPGYQFQMEQGNQAITNANAQGGIGGNALKALQGWGQNTANQGWQQYLNNVSGGYNTLTGNLDRLVSGGQSAAGGIGNAAMSLGSEIGGNQLGAGQAKASGIIGGANALTGGIGGAAGAVGNGAQQYMLLNYLQSLQGGGLPTAANFNTAAQNSPFMTGNGLVDYPQLGG